MNRRSVIAALGGMFLSLFARVATAQESRPTVDTSDFSDPQVIDTGLTIVDQRLRVRSDGTSVFLAEIKHDRNEVFDTPSFIQTFLDSEGNIVGEGRVFGVVGFMRPGESDFLIGRFSDGFDPNLDEWDSYIFQYTNGGWPGQIQIVYTWNPGMEIAEVSSEKKTGDGYSAVVEGLNVSGIDMSSGICTLVFRDGKGHFVGYGEDRVQSTIPNGKQARFRPAVSRDSGETYNPFEFIAEGEDYTVEIIVSGAAY